VTVLWLLAVLLLTPVILLAGLIALIGTVALGTIKRVRTEATDFGCSHFAPVVQLDNPAADVLVSRAA
jgi:hypothetical protein